MKKTLKSIMLLSMAGLLSACSFTTDDPVSSVTSGSETGETSDTTSTGPIDDKYRVVEPEGYVYGIQGLEAKKTYRSLIYFESSIPNLNYMNTSEAADAQHFANFIDGLLTHNEFGVLVKNLATEVTVNEDNTRFKFTIRDNVPWVRYDGSQYEAVVDGVKRKQFVKPSDWLTSAEQILTAQNGSSLEYLISDFVKGAAEFYYYKEAVYKALSDPNGAGKTLKTDAQKATYINKQIKTNKENLWNIYYADNQVTAGDIPAIKSLSRLGIKANDEDMTLEYELLQGAYYFPTLMTYSCYLPVNKYFFQEKSWSKFGVKNDSILYNGPFLFTEEGDNELIYSKNPLYWNPSIVNVDQVIYTVYDNTIGNDYTRTQYFAGNIDGFGVNQRDTIGWKQFITGENGEGTIYDPVSGEVNARLLDTIGSMYGSNITLARSKDSGSATSYSTKGSPASVKNTEKALALEPVRRAILNALDYNSYYKHYGEEEPFKSQYKVNTYVPKNFVQSPAGDYVSTHYYQEYARKKGIQSGTSVNDGATLAEDGTLIPNEGTAAWLLENGRIDRCNLTDAEVYALAQNAKAAMDLWNTENPSDQITFPVQVEYYTAWDVDTTGDTKKYDGESILRMNQRLNGTMSEAVADYGWFYVVPTDALTSSTAETCSHAAAFDYAPVLWGWGADYGDPLTYMNTYVKGGDWKSIFPYVGYETVDNYFYEEVDGTPTLRKTDLLAEYTSLVKAGAQITDDINARFNKFAEAEYMLMEELSIYKPQINYGQGWSLSISKAAGYHMPQSNYGLSSDRMTGLWVLEKALTRTERNAVRANQEAAKKAYIAAHGTIDIYNK